MGLVIGVAGKVVLAVALAVGATVGVRYLRLARDGWKPGRGRLRVVETAALGQNRALHLVSVGGRTLFIASTSSQVVLLADVTGEEGEGPAGEAQSAPGTRRSFASLLRGLVGDRGGEEEGGDKNKKDDGLYFQCIYPHFYL